MKNLLSDKRKRSKKMNTFQLIKKNFGFCNRKIKFITDCKVFHKKYKFTNEEMLPLAPKLFMKLN